MSYAAQPPVTASPTANRPAAVTTAVALLWTMAVSGLAYATSMVAIAPATVSRFRAATGGSEPAESFIAVIWLDAAVAAVLAILVVALFVVLGLGLRRGSRLARGVTFAVCALGIVGGVASLTTLGVQRSGEALAGSVGEALGDAYPNGWLGLNAAVAGAQILAYLLVGALLLMAPRQFFGGAAVGAAPGPEAGFGQFGGFDPASGAGRQPTPSSGAGWPAAQPSNAGFPGYGPSAVPPGAVFPGYGPGPAPGHGPALGAYPGSGAYPPPGYGAPAGWGLPPAAFPYGPWPQHGHPSGHSPFTPPPATASASAPAEGAPVSAQPAPAPISQAQSEASGIPATSEPQPLIASSPVNLNESSVTTPISNPPEWALAETEQKSSEPDQSSSPRTAGRPAAAAEDEFRSRAPDSQPGNDR